MADKHLDRGIWQTPYGFRILIRIGKQLHTKRFPPTVTLDWLRQWRNDHQRLHRHAKPRGTFAADVDNYLKAVAAMPTFSDRKRQIEAWLPRFGERARWTIQPDEIRAQMAEWRTVDKKAANTCNHRRSALSHLFTVLEGKSGFNPVRDVPPYALEPPLRRGLPMAIVVKVLKQIHGPKTRARLELLAWTGLRPSELARLTPDLVDVRNGVALIPTAKGGPAREIALTKPARSAWARLVKLDALGPFSVQSTRKSLVRACKAVGVTPFRVYDLRHSFLSALRQSGADLSDVQAQAGHSDIALTRRYAPTITHKLRMAVAKVTAKNYQRTRTRRNTTKH